MGNYITNGDSRDLYYSEIAQYSLLTTEEEVELAALIREGGKKGEEARFKLINSNLRLVVKISKEFENMGLDVQDLINEGNMGLMKAASRFEPEKGAKFSTYAGYWIRQGIYRALSNKSRTIRLPVHVAGINTKVNNFIQSYREDNPGQMPTIKEIANRVGATERLINDIINGGVTNLLSLDKEVGNQDGTKESFGSIVEDAKMPEPSEINIKEESVEVLKKLIQKLNNRERYIICNRYGLGNKKSKTLDEIGEYFGLTRERIRQIQQVAMMKLQDYMVKYYRQKPEVTRDFIDGRRTIAKRKRAEKLRRQRKKCN